MTLVHHPTAVIIGAASLAWSFATPALADWIVVPEMAPRPAVTPAAAPAPTFVQAPAAAPSAPASPVAAPSEDDDDDIAARALERTLVQRGALLMPVWAAEIEPAVSFTYSSADLFIVVPGAQIGERRRSDNLTATLAGRLGLPWESQVEIRVPYVYQKRESVLGGTTIVDSDETDIGDIELAVSRQLLNERGWVPDALVTLRWKSDTGTNDFTGGAATGSGFNALSGTLVVAKAQDPLVFFGKLGYTWNIEDDKALGTVDPGDGWGMTVGGVLAVSPYTSINLSLNTLFVGRTDVNGASVPVSDATVAVFEIGASSILTPKTLLNVTAGLGLTADSPDFQITVSLPIRL